MGSYALKRLQAADAKRKAEEEKKNETVTAIDAATSETLRSNMQAKKDAAETSKIDQSSLKKKSVQDKRDREEFSDAADVPSEAEIRADAAKKQLEMYKNSDEKRRNAEKRLQDKYAQQLLYGITDSSEVLYDEDPREKELQAEADYWDGKVREEKDAKLFAANMQEIQSLSDTERTAFENYANNRTFVDPENLEAFKRLQERYGDKLQDLKYTYQRNKEEQAALATAEKTAAKMEAAKMEQGGVLADIGRNVASVGANLLGGITGTAGRINELFNGTGPYETAAKYTAGDILGVYGQTVRDKTTEQILGGQEMNLGDGISGKELGALAYQGVMGALDNGARLVAAGGNPFAAAGLAASQTFSTTVQEATENGATPQQAYALAVTNAGIEALTEKLPLDNLVKIVKGGAKPKVFVNLLLQAGAEIGEEEASLIGTTLAEAAILREKSDYQQAIGKATAMGVPYKQAVAEADRALLEEAKQTALVSGFSGILSAVGAEYVNSRFAGTSTERQQTAQQPRTAQQEQAPIQTEQAAQPVQTAPAADFVAETARQQAQMVPPEVKEPMPEGLRHFDNAAAIANGITPESQGVQQGQETAASEETAAFKNPTREELSAKPDIPVIEVRANSDSKTYQQMKADVFNTATLGKWYDTPRINADTGMPVFLSKNTFTHAFSNLTAEHGADTILAASNAPALIENAVLVNTAPPKNPQKAESKVHTFMAAIRTETGVKPVKITVKEYDVKKENRLPQNILNYFKKTKPETQYQKAYDIKALEVVDIQSVKNEFGASADAIGSHGQPTETSTPNSTIRVADLLDLVKGDAEKYIPKPASIDSTSKADTQIQSADGGQIKGTGAAETGFTPKQAMINEYGNIPEGENPVRPDQFPRSTDGNDRVSYTARTAAEARVTPDEFVPLIEHEVVNRGFSFIPITNDETVRNVTQRISYDGWQTSRANWTAQVRAGVTSPEITATGALLYNHAVNAGDTQEAMNILMDYQMAVRNSARSLQAARILKTLTPSDRLWMIRRSVDAMVQDMNLETPVTINESLAQSYQNAGTQEEADALLDQIAEDVARQIPATRMEAFTALRYLNMLGNFRTQARNVLGNVGSKLVYGLKDKIGAGVETIASAVTGGRVERTKAFATDRSTRQAAARDYEQVREWVMGNGRYNDRQTESDDFARRVQERRQMLPRGLEEARRLTEWAMNTGDEIFARDAYARALAGYLNARGIRTDNLETVDTNLMDRAREYAVRQAQEQTFRDNNQVSDFVSGIMRGRNTPTWARVIGEGVMPFRRTPANVLVRAEEFSPLGIINSAVNTVRAARGNISGEELIDSWAKSLTGTALTAMGWALYGMGVLSGGPDDDEYAEAYNQMNGDQNYAIRLKVGDREYTYTIDWATPAAMPMFLGAQLKKAFDNTADFDWADAEKVLTSIGDPLIQMSMLQGINDTLDSIKYSDNSMGQFLINSIVSYVTQGISNTLLGQLEKSTEGERTMTYVDKDSATPEWLQKQLGKLSQKVPGWDYQQTEYINAKGETEKQPTGLSGVLYNMLSPGYAKEVHTDAVTEEMNRLNNANIEGNVFPSAPDKTLTWTDKAGTVHKDYNLTPEEYQTMATTQGQTAERIKGEIIQSTAYKAMTDQQKADVMDTIDRYAGEAGKAAALKDYDGMENWMKDITPENAVQTFIRKSVDSSMTGAFSDVVDDWNRGTDTAQSVEALDAAYKNYQAMGSAERKAFYEDASGRVKYFIDSKKDGMSTETFTEMYRQYRDIDGKDLSVKDKAQEWSYALEKAVDAGTITEKQKDTMKGNMQFRYSFAAETAKFDTMIEAGIPTDRADQVIQALSGAIGTGSDGSVRDIDTRQTIATMEGLSDAAIDEIMKCYMGDYDPNAEKKEYTELKYDYIREVLGLSPKAYAETYRAHLDNSNKDAKIAAIMKLGYDEQTATALYNVYSSNTTGKNAYMGYYNRYN